MLFRSTRSRRITLYRRNFHYRSAAANRQRRHNGNRVLARTVAFLWMLVTFITFLSFIEETLVCASDDAAQQADDANVNNDDAAVAANGDDAVAAAEESNDDAAAAAEETNDDNTSSNSAYENEQKQYQDTDDDTFHWNQNIGFDGVSVMPLSCIN